MEQQSIHVSVAALLPAYSKDGAARPGHTYRPPRRNFIKGGHERRLLQPVWRMHVHQFANAVAKYEMRVKIATAVRIAISKVLAADAQAAAGTLAGGHVSGVTSKSQAVRCAEAALGVYREVKNPGRSITRIIRELERTVAGLPARRR